MTDTEHHQQPTQWEGGRITNRLQLWPHEDFDGMWVIHGKEENNAALASPEGLLKLAETIMEHFGYLKEEPEHPQPGHDTAALINQSQVGILRYGEPNTLDHMLAEVTESNRHPETETAPYTAGERRDN